MTTPSEPGSERPKSEGVDLGKADPAAEAPFDPYRFGAPDHPVPAEYAPPGYTGPTAPPPAQNPAPGTPFNPYPPGAGTDNPFANPPGTPYGGAPNPYQYPPAGYGPGAPVPPPYHGYAQPGTGNGKAIAALVLGICSIVFCWLSVFDGVFVILALVFGLLALGDARNGRSGGRGMAIAGLACMVVGALLATLITIKYAHAIQKCGGLDQSNSDTFKNCLQDNL